MSARHLEMETASLRGCACSTLLENDRLRSNRVLTIETSSSMVPRAPVSPCLCQCLITHLNIFANVMNMKWDIIVVCFNFSEIEITSSIFHKIHWSLLSSSIWCIFKTFANFSIEPSPFSNSLVKNIYIVKILYIVSAFVHGPFVTRQSSFNEVKFVDLILWRVLHVSCLRTAPVCRGHKHIILPFPLKAS